MTTTQRQPDRFDLYEQAAQSPEMQARFLRALAGERSAGALTLGEDFCGTGAVSRAWLALDPTHRAVCVDRDAAPLARLRDRSGDTEARLTIHPADVMDVHDPADLIAALNFSVCEIHDRTALVAYLRHTRSRLSAGSGGVGTMVIDLYGGVDAFAVGESDVELRDGVRYVWEQRFADPLTARVVNAMHFIPEEGPPLRDAFVYDWRLWSVPEFREALCEAGFDEVEIHDRLGDAIDDAGRVYARPIESADDLDENFVVYLVARAR